MIATPDATPRRCSPLRSAATAEQLGHIRKDTERRPPNVLRNLRDHLRRGRWSIREHSISAVWKVGSGPACLLVRIVAEVRHRLSVRDAARGHLARFRSRYHPLRQCRPLRPTASCRTAELRAGVLEGL